jgi:NTE family protein
MARRSFWRKPRVGLALSGGGARGLAHLGVIEVLDHLGVQPCAIAGTSAGSIFGALYAAKIPIKKIINIAMDAQWTKLVRPVLPGGSGLLSLEPLEKMLEHELGKTQRFSELPIPFACMATDIEREEPVVLRDGPLAPAIRASCAVPGIFTPVELDGRLLVDGGIVNNLPVRLLESMGAEYVIAVDLLPRRTGPMRPKGYFELLTVTFYNMVRSTSHEGLLANVLIVPDIRDFGFADFSRRADLIARGRAAARSVEQKLKKDLALGASPNPLAILWARIHALLGRLYGRVRALSSSTANAGVLEAGVDRVVVEAEPRIAGGRRE